MASDLVENATVECERCGKVIDRKLARRFPKKVDGEMTWTILCSRCFDQRYLEEHGPPPEHPARK